MLKPGTIVKVYNDGRCKLAVVKQVNDNYCIVNGIFSTGVLYKIDYKIKTEKLEKINLLYELELYNKILKK